MMANRGPSRRRASMANDSDRKMPGTLKKNGTAQQMLGAWQECSVRSVRRCLQPALLPHALKIAGQARGRRLPLRSHGRCWRFASMDTPATDAAAGARIFKTKCS